MMYQGIFDTDFDKYCEDAVALFGKTGIQSDFEALEGWPADWTTNSCVHSQVFPRTPMSELPRIQRASLCERDEIKKALKLKAAFSGMLDLMQ